MQPVPWPQIYMDVQCLFFMINEWTFSRWNCEIHIFFFLFENESTIYIVSPLLPPPPPFSTKNEIIANFSRDQNITDKYMYISSFYSIFNIKWFQKVWINNLICIILYSTNIQKWLSSTPGIIFMNNQKWFLLQSMKSRCVHYSINKKRCKPGLP